MSVVKHIVRPVFGVLAAVLAVGAVSSCDLPYELSGDCSDELRSAMRVDIVDSLTGAPAAAGATVWVRGNAFLDSVHVADSATTAAAAYWMEDKVRGGTYSVEVRKAGYRVWVRESIRIDADRCHVRSFAFVTARLQR
jgi:hypothetical protein